MKRVPFHLPPASSGVKRSGSTVQEPASGERPTRMQRTDGGPQGLSRQPTRPVPDALTREGASSPGLPLPSFAAPSEAGWASQPLPPDQAQDCEALLAGFALEDPFDELYLLLGGGRSATPAMAAPPEAAAESPQCLPSLKSADSNAAPAGADPLDPESQLLGVARRESQEWTQDEAEDLLAMFSGADEEARIEALGALHYSAEQIKSIKPGARSAVVEHHRALTGHGFGREQICKISTCCKSLAFLAHSYPRVQQTLPTLSLDDVVQIAQRRSGESALTILLLVAPDLKKATPHFTDQQLARIAKRGERPALLKLSQLSKAPSFTGLGLSSEQVVRIASITGGGPALEAVESLLLQLHAPPYNLTKDQVVNIARRGGGKPALEAVQRMLPGLCAEPHALNKNQVAAIASCFGGKQALEAVQRLLPGLCTEPHALHESKVVAIASKGGKQALEAVHRLLSDLCTGDYALTKDQVAAIACRSGGKQALEALQKLWTDLCSGPHALSKKQVVAIASSRLGKQALEAVHRLMRQLGAGAPALNMDQVVAVAIRKGSKKALDNALKQIAADHSPDIG